MREKTKQFLQHIQTLLFSVLVVVCFGVHNSAFADCDGPGVALTTGVADTRTFDDISSIISGTGTSRKVVDIESISAYLQNQDWYVQFDDGVVHGYSGCAGRSVKKASAPYSYSTFANSAYSGCLCSLTPDGDTWYPVNMTTSNVVEDGTDWVDRNTYCRQYCASACAAGFASNEKGLRTAMIDAYGSCPVIAGTDTRKKYCEAGTYLPANATNDTLCAGCESGYYCPGGSYDLEAYSRQGIYSCTAHSTSAGDTSTCKCEVGYSKDGTFEGDINVGYGETCVKIEIDYMSVNSSYYSYNTDIESLESLVERGIVVPRRDGEEISRSNNKIKSFTEYTKDESWSVTFVDANYNELYTVSGYAFCSTKSNQTTTPIGTHVTYGSIDDQSYVGCWCKLGENGNDGNYWTRLDVVSPNSDDWYEDTNYCRENCPARCAQEVASNQEFREYIYDSDTIPTDTGCETGYAWSSTAYMCKKICVENAHDGGDGYCVCDDGYSVDGTETGAIYAEGANCKKILYCDINEFIVSGGCQTCPENSHSDGSNVYQCECDDGFTINGRDDGENITSGQACIKIKLNVNYDYTNGGSGCANETFTPGIEKELNCVPFNDGYRFLGWYDAVENGNLITSISFDVSEDITLYAYWESYCSDNAYWDGHSCVCKEDYEAANTPWLYNAKIDADDYEPNREKHSDTYDELRNAMRWRVSFYDIPDNREMAGIALSGRAFCSNNPSDHTIPITTTAGSDVKDILSGAGQYCWCKMTAPALSKWVFAADFASGVDVCRQRCPVTCGQYIAGGTASYSNVRKAIYDNILTFDDDDEGRVCIPYTPDIPYDGSCDSDKWFHVGDEKMCLLEEVQNRPALAVKIGTETYYLNMSDSDLPINSTSSKKMHVLYGGDIYNIHDNSVE